jgi:hypothetical protein
MYMCTYAEHMYMFRMAGKSKAKAHNSTPRPFNTYIHTYIHTTRQIHHLRAYVPHGRQIKSPGSQQLLSKDLLQEAEKEQVWQQ